VHSKRYSMLDTFSTDAYRSPIVVLTPEGNASGRIPRFHPLPPPAWAFLNVFVCGISRSSMTLSTETEIGNSNDMGLRI
jgi:hypothetical protein